MARSNIFSLLMLSDSFGLNKEAQRRREREQAAGPALRLEPPFPYDVLGFDDRFFGAEPSDIHEEATKPSGGGQFGGRANGFSGGGGQFGGGGASGSF